MRIAKKQKKLNATEALYYMCVGKKNEEMWRKIESVAKINKTIKIQVLCFRSIRTTYWTCG